MSIEIWEDGAEIRENILVCYDDFYFVVIDLAEELATIKSPFNFQEIKIPVEELNRPRIIPWAKHVCDWAKGRLNVKVIREAEVRPEEQEDEV